MSAWESEYIVTADFLPYRAWMITAESESEARLKLVELLGVPYEETSASLGGQPTQK